MKTFGERTHFVVDMFTDPGVKITNKEKFIYCYYWLQYEFARKSGNTSVRTNYANKLNDIKDTYILRKYMN